MKGQLLPSSPFPCSYLPQKEALYEQYWITELTGEELEELFALGYRSFGAYTFRPQCTSCHRCLPLRVPTSSFTPSSSQKRVLKKCAHVELTVAPPQFTEEKFLLYKDHLNRFPSSQTPCPEEFRSSFYTPSPFAKEFSYFIQGSLAAVGIVLESPRALSSVYFFYASRFSSLSLGTFSVLKELDYGTMHQKTHLYLGYWIKENRFMRYKSAFRPCEALRSEGKWVPFRNKRGEYLEEEGEELTFSPR